MSSNSEDHEASENSEVSEESIRSESEGNDTERSDDELTSLRKEMEDVPFEELQKIQSDGRALGLKKLWQKEKEAGKKPRKRENKNMPQELPIHKPVPRFRQVIETPKFVPRDPRFESLCGKYDENRFKNSYNFIFTENLPSEKEKLAKYLKKEKNPEKRKNLKLSIKKIERELQSEERRKKTENKEKTLKSEERKAVKEGKKPFFLKKSEKKKQDLVEKYKELKATGKLDKFLSKKRKKNAAKEHKKIPFRRSAEV